MRIPRLVLSILTVLAFLLSMTGSLEAKAILLDRVVAVVGKEVVTWSELYKSMEFEFAGRLSGISPEERRKILSRYEKDYLEKIIDTKLQLNEAKKKNIRVTRSELDAAVDEIRKRFGMSMDEFTETLKREGFTMREYRKKLAEQIIISKLLDREIRSRIVVTEKEIEDELGEKENAETPAEELRIRQILLLKPPGESREAVEKRAAEIIKEFNEGESFESLAIRYSEGPNAKQGGDLGYIKKSSLAKPFLEALDGLEPGQISGAFWTERGLHILYLEDRIRSVDALKDKIRERLTERKFRQKFRQWMKALRSREFIEIKL
jgi:peptidyl-prolyl cis-trans isomerase SurA